MTYTISKKKEYIEITITDVGDQKDRVLASFGMCQKGQCQCPTDQYANLDRMEIVEDDSKLTLQLYPKPGLDMDLDEIRKCLDFTTGQ